MLNIEQDKLLAPYTTFNVGGAAKYFIEVFDEKGLLQAIEFAQDKNLPIFILGGGSNILISDEGFDGLVILNRIKGLEIDPVSGRVRMGAGEVWDEMVKKVVEASLGGLECLSGVPGSVGGAVVQNIGAYGQTISDVIEEVEILNTETLNIEKLSAAECKFVYRNSLFKSNPGKYVLNYVVMKLMPDGKPAITYHDLVDYFQGREPTVAEVRDAVIEIRARKGMVITQSHESYQSAGSYFKNPIIEKMHFDEIHPDLSVDAPATPWFWELPDGRIKIAAAFLIGAAGFGKGTSFGEAGVSPKHNQSLINLGNAKAIDIKNLSDKIKIAVEKKFGIPLEEEILMIGKF